MRQPARYLLALLALVLLAASAVHCVRRIGDGCTTATDCSINGDRRCDTSSREGYCTIGECEANSCPDDALCIEFEAQIPRLSRRFCMAGCDLNAPPNPDGTSPACRAGYACVAPTVNVANDAGVVREPACMFADPDSGAPEPPCTRQLDTAPPHVAAHRGFCAPAQP